MSCRQIEKWIAIERDGLLSDRQQRRLARHLAQCPSCRQKQRELRQMGELMRALPDKPLPQGFEERLMRHLASARQPKARLYWVKPVSVAAAAVVLVAAVGLGVRLGNGLFNCAAPPPRVEAQQKDATAAEPEAPMLASGMAPETGQADDGYEERAAQPEALNRSLDKSAGQMQDMAACAGYLVQAPASRQGDLRAELPGEVYTGEGLMAALLPPAEAQALVDRWGASFPVETCLEGSGPEDVLAWIAAKAPARAEALAQLGQDLGESADGLLVVILLDEGA